VESRHGNDFNSFSNTPQSLAQVKSDGIESDGIPIQRPCSDQDWIKKRRADWNLQEEGGAGANHQAWESV
jgi:hypothetical protein